MMESVPLIRKAAIVDDDTAHLMLYERTVRRSGLVKDLLKFQSAEDALRHLEDGTNERVEVIFLDINMPRMNGFEFLDAANRSMGANFTDCVVIMLTTSIDSRDQQRANEFEAVKLFLNKPLTVEALHDVVSILDSAM
jgi:CheY-like chemotaxis protein